MARPSYEEDAANKTVTNKKPEARTMEAKMALARDGSKSPKINPPITVIT